MTRVARSGAGRLGWHATDGLPDGAQRMTVDLPDPFYPRKPKIEPLPTENETCSTAVK